MEERMKELVEQLNEASEAYYLGKEEILSNYEWDTLFDELTELETKTGIHLPDSPTNKTGAIEKGEKVEHEYPALSLAKSKKVSDLISWAKRKPIWLSYKLDGNTLVITYDNGVLSQIASRGNGIVGTNISHLAGAIMGIPLKIKEKGHLIVRGEAVISYADFETINATLPSEEQYSNPRNLSAGTLNLDDPREVEKRYLQFIAFTLVHTEKEIVSWGKRMDFLSDNGFQVVEHQYVEDPTVDLPYYIEQFTAKVEKGMIDNPVDGLVIVYDDTDYAATGSVTSHHATNAGFAFKWEDLPVETKLIKIEWSVGTSVITPVAIFEPVQIEGTMVNRASLCNVSELERLNIGGEDSLLQIIKSNMIIPKCIGVTKKVGEAVIPSKCPVCGADTKIRVGKNGAKMLYCTNSDCPGKSLRKFEKFVNKEAMDINGLSIQTLSQFINKGFLKDFADIYHLSDHYTEIANMDGFGVKSADNLMAAIEKSRTVSCVKFIKSLSIPIIGTDFGKTVFSQMSFEEFWSALDQKKSFEHLDGIGPEKMAALNTWYEDEKNKELVSKLRKETIVEDLPMKKTDGKCKGLVFVITGDVHTFANRSEFKKYVESENGKVSGSVSKKTNFLVENHKEGTALTTKSQRAKDLGVEVISEDEFLARFKG